MEKQTKIQMLNTDTLKHYALEYLNGNDIFCGENCEPLQGPSDMTKLLKGSIFGQIFEELKERGITYDNLKEIPSCFPVVREFDAATCIADLKPYHFTFKYRNIYYSEHDLANALVNKIIEDLIMDGKDVFTKKINMAYEHEFFYENVEYEILGLFTLKRNKLKKLVLKIYLSLNQY
jgi:hypothetical protein